MRSICLMLIWSCLTCTANGHAVQSSAEPERGQRQASCQALEAHRLDALATVLIAANPCVAFSLPGHACNFAQTNPSFRKDMMKTSVKSSVAYKRYSRPGVLMNATATAVVSRSGEETTMPPQFLRTATRLNEKLAETMRASLAALTTRKAWMACAIGICADLVAQVIAGARVFEDWVPRQTLAMAVWSLCYTGAFRRVVDKQFDRLCGQGTSTREVCAKQFVELFLFKPIFHVPALYMATGLMAGKGLLGSWHKLCNVYQETMLFSWVLWPVPLYVYFRYIPYKHRVLYYSFFAFIQKCGFSYLSLPGKR